MSEVKEPKAVEKKVKVSREITDMTDRAERAQAQMRAARAAAPDGILVTKPVSDVRQKQLIAAHASIDGFDGQDADGGFHYMFGDRDLSNEYPDQGYVPCMDRGTNGTRKQEACQGDPMWKIPTDLYELALSDRANKAKAIAEQRAIEDTKAANKTGYASENIQTAQPGTEAGAQILREAGVGSG